MPGDNRKDRLDNIWPAEHHLIIAKSRLAVQLDLFAAVVQKLHEWLAGNPEMPISLKRTFSLSLNSCGVIISGIEDHVKKVAPRNDETKISLARKLRLLWNEDAMKEHERMVANQFQAFNLLLTLTHL
jgi:hypothetical protein